MATRDKASRIRAQAMDMSRRLNKRHENIKKLKKQLEKERLKAAVQEELVEGQPILASQREKDLVDKVKIEKHGYKKLKREYDELRKVVSQSMQKVEAEQATMKAEFRAWLGAKQHS
mmetsp:Transcript_8773/g.17189  ORF Transcript_8773/g.17189 Transcript_8773/m.17189 type:complete len:117 (+) Transcript_8773:69-419(+)